MKRPLLVVAIALLMSGAIANAATFRFISDPFEGSDALITPGRQIVGGEPFITFNISADLFSVEPTVFGVGDEVLLANALVDDLPTGGVNFVVLQTTDNDDDPMTPFGAGSAATLIAGQIADSAPGFFIYFNSGLDLPRLVYSTDLSDDTADLKIIARMVNLSGAPGRAALPTFTEANFDITAIPEPSSILLMTGAAAFWGLGYVRRRSRGTRA